MDLSVIRRQDEVAKLECELAIARAPNRSENPNDAQPKPSVGQSEDGSLTLSAHAFQGSTKFPTKAFQRLPEETASAWLAALEANTEPREPTRLSCWIPLPNSTRASIEFRLANQGLGAAQRSLKEPLPDPGGGPDWIVLLGYPDMNGTFDDQSTIIAVQPGRGFLVHASPLLASAYIALLSDQPRLPLNTHPRWTEIRARLGQPGQASGLWHIQRRAINFLQPHFALNLSPTWCLELDFYARENGTRQVWTDPSLSLVPRLLDGDVDAKADPHFAFRGSVGPLDPDHWYSLLRVADSELTLEIEIRTVTGEFADSLQINPESEAKAQRLLQLLRGATQAPAEVSE